MRAFVAGVIATAALAAVSHGQAASGQVVVPGPSSSAPEITASGRGETSVTPTSSSVAISVTTRARTAAQAAADNATRLESTLRALRGMGLEPNELATLGYNVEQNYESTRDGRQTPSGFVARNTIRAEVRKLADLGKVIDAAIAGGATEVSGIQFIAANSEEARRSALAEAVAEARADAEVIARAAGGRLGRLIAINSFGGPQLMSGMYEFTLASSMAPAPPTSITPRALTIAAQVSTRWEFIPGTAR